MPKQAHDAQRQASTREGSDVKRNDRHNDYEKWNIHENRQSGLAGDLLEQTTRVSYAHHSGHVDAVRQGLMLEFSNSTVRRARKDQ